jgi:hypothetical protein
MVKKSLNFFNLLEQQVNQVNCLKPYEHYVVPGDFSNENRVIMIENEDLHNPANLNEKNDLEKLKAAFTFKVCPQKNLGLENHFFNSVWKRISLVAIRKERKIEEKKDETFKSDFVKYGESLEPGARYAWMTMGYEDDIFHEGVVDLRNLKLEDCGLIRTSEMAKVLDVEPTRRIMMENIESLIANGEELDVLQEKSAEIHQASSSNPGFSFSKFTSKILEAVKPTPAQVKSATKAVVKHGEVANVNSTPSTVFFNYYANSETDLNIFIAPSVSEKSSSLEDVESQAFKFLEDFIKNEEARISPAFTEHGWNYFVEYN